MFVSQENVNTKKKFQKPNILRKKPKIPVLTHSNMFDAQKSPDTKHEANLTSVKEANPDETKINRTNLHDNPDSSHDLVNIETFFNDTSGENVMLYDIGYDPEKPTVVFIDSESPGIQDIEFIEGSPDPINSVVPMTADISDQSQNSVNTSIGFSIPSTIAKFKCDAPNCTKVFRSEQKLKKHKNIHNEDGSIKAPRQITVECPVKKNTTDGSEQPCGKIFLVRDLLLKHLNEEHNLDDAAYRCEECGRRFFWASGLRAHARAHCRQAERARAGAGAGAGAGVLACLWPGCGRVFRQPCRLREHARSHTGDRPYPCQYPNCGWSFRSASKLVRHARRHTGERRHACGACGRAFLRREHLRDHAARHHAPRHARVRRLCTHDGCEQTFSNMSTLYMHMKKVHKNKEVPAAAPRAEPAPAPAIPVGALALTTLEPDHTFLVNFEPDGSLVTESLPQEEQEIEAGADRLEGGEGEGEREGGSEWHSARTHCTWPLPPRPSPEYSVTVGDNAVLEEDISVEPSESSESNIFTVRSDLFLHGNVLINDDSEHNMEESGEATGVGADGSAAGAGCGDTLDTDLGLLDAHTNIDLMQEELMYTDVAGDESSFRIFLLSGEELA